MILTVFPPSPLLPPKSFGLSITRLFIAGFVGAPFRKRVVPEKKKIFRLAPLPGRASLYLPSFVSQGPRVGRVRAGGGEIRGNEWEKRNSIDSGGSKELPMCHWSKWNHRRAFSSATTMRTPIAQKGSGRTQVTPVVVSSSCFRHRKWLTNIRGQCRLKLTAFV